MIELINLWRQHRRCRRGDHAWTTIFAGVRSDFVKCDYCPETGYRIKETA